MLSDSSDNWKIVCAIDALERLDRHVDHLKITRLVRDFADREFDFKYPKEDMIHQMIDNFLLNAQMELDEALSNLRNTDENTDFSSSNVTHFPCLKRVKMQ